MSWIPFRDLPGTGQDAPRPIVDVGFQGFEDTLLSCLIDTGSLGNRVAWWVARDAGIDLSGVEATSIGVGGRPVIARTVPVRMSIGDDSWEAPVSFCEPWPWPFQLLGQEGFFRYFVVVLQAAERRFSIERLKR